MSEQQYHVLLNKLIHTQDEKELREVIQIHLTLTLHPDFDSWLWDQISELRKTDSALVTRVEQIRFFIRRLQETGDYLKAQFDEAHPSNLAEVLLALTRRVERGELELSAAVEQGIRSLSEKKEYIQPLDQDALARSIYSAQDPAPYATLAELMYQIEQQIPALKHEPRYPVVINTRLAEVSKLLEHHDYDRVLQVFDRVVAIAEQSGNARDLSTVLMHLGNISKISLEPSLFPDHLIRAEQYYSHALKTCEQKLLGSELRAEILMELGTTLTRQEERIEEGISRLEECLAIRRSFKVLRPKPIFDCLVALVDAYMDVEDLEAASTAIRDALAIALTRDMKEVTPTLISQMEGLAAATGYLVDRIGAGADEAVEAATLLAEKLALQPSAHTFRSSVYTVRGSYLRQKGDIQGALDTYTVAIEEARASGDEKSAARWLSNRWQTNLLLGWRKEADVDFREAVEGHARFKDYRGAANLMMSYGHKLLSEGELIQAADAWAKAFTYFYKTGMPLHHRMGLAAVNLSLVYQKRGDFQRAEACISYALSKGANARRDIFYATSALATVQARQGHAEEAVKTYTEAIALAQQIGELASEPALRIERGQLLEEASSASEEAQRDYQRAIELYESMRGYFRAIERRMQMQNRSEEAYALLIRLLSKRSELAEACSKAFAYSERARSRTLVDLLSRRPVRQPASLPQKLALREENLLRQLLRLEATENVEEASEDVGLQVAQRYAQLSQELNEVWDEMAKIDKACSDYVDLRRTPLVNVAEIAGLLNV